MRREYHRYQLRQSLHPNGIQKSPVREVFQPGWLRTAPDGGGQSLFLNSSGFATVDFGNLLIDITGDGQVDADDIDALNLAIGIPPTLLTDLDSNGIVDREDVRNLVEVVL